MDKIIENANTIKANQRALYDKVTDMIIVSSIPDDGKKRLYKVLHEAFDENASLLDEIIKTAEWNK